MSNTITITCPRCGDATKVELTMGMSGQRCNECGNFLYSANTGAPLPLRRRERRRTWRSIFTTYKSELEVEAMDPDSKLHDAQRGVWSTWMPLMLVIGSLLVLSLTYYFINLEDKRGTYSGGGPDDVVQTSLDGKIKPRFDDKRTIIGDFAEIPDSVDPVWAEKVATVANLFLSTKDINEVIRLTRNSAKFEAEIRKTLAGKDALPLSQFGADEILYSVTSGDKKVVLALLFFQNREERSQGIVLSETPEGIQVDWPTLSGRGEMTIDEFLLKRPTEPTLLRVAARKIDYYNFEFTKDKQLQALRMTEFPEQQVIYGYVKKEAEIYKKIVNLPEYQDSAQSSLPTVPRPLTIKAKFQPGSKSPNQVEVVEVLGNGWYVQ